ncbi:MAG TPA: alpha/beta hydrolase-fold protein [Nocardioides sp.]|nr:alpha/beta hydrolase-fold protein [Nocardioides sp.]
MGIEQIDIDSALLGEPARVVLARPESTSHAPVPWVWLLHGSRSAVADVTWMVEGLDAARGAGDAGAYTIAAPVGPWSETAWWVDSEFVGGRPVESAVLTEVLPEVERQYGGPASRDDRIIAGYSMGGGAALAWALRHDDLFGAAALAAPAAFAEGPPVRSSTDETGAFGVGDQQFDPDRWASLMSYPLLLADRRSTSAPLRVGTVVGDAEVIEDYPFGRSSLTLEAAKLHIALTDAPGVTSSLRVIGAGHTWDFWIPAISQALELVSGPTETQAS